MTPDLPTLGSGTAVGLTIAFYLVGGAALALTRISKSVALWVGHLALVCGGLSGGATAYYVLRTRSELHLALPRLIPFADLSLSLDGLSAFFLLIISLVAVAAGVYGPSYLLLHAKPPSRRKVGMHVLCLNAFVGSMVLLCCASDAMSFLFLWEAMTLASYVLVITDRESSEDVHAALFYLVMAHVGTALLVLAFLVLAARADGFGFAELKTAAAGLAAGPRTAVFLAMFIGFATKAGAVPLHVWLPRAHPAAPSHVSALMSGAMVKVALYGILRFCFTLLVPATGVVPVSWGWVVLLTGTLSAVVGVLFALQQDDLKRLLAFSTVENVGIILIGVGLAMLLRGQPDAPVSLAALALGAALFHALNHAAFKGLLFLGSGSVIAGAHGRDLETLGGLARRMPWTTWTFLIGAISIAGLPPLNGFASEWLTFQALILGGAQVKGGIGMLSIIAASMLALTGGLAAVAFVKAFGITFLGRPRSEHAERAREAPVPMLAGMALLAAACLLLGIGPGFALKLLEAPTAVVLKGAELGGTIGAQGSWILSAKGLAAGSGADISITGAALFFSVVALLCWFAKDWPRKFPTRRASTWTCGIEPEQRFDYTATAFAKPLRLIFAAVYQSRRALTREVGDSPYELRGLSYRGEIVDWAEVTLYTRTLSWISGAARGIRARSTGRVHGYIAYVLVTLLLTLLAFGRGAAG